MSPEDQAAVNEYISEFFDAARYGELEDLQVMFGHERLRQLIDFPSLIDESTGSSPLMLAAANGHSECVEFLSNTVSVPVNYKNKNGNTALHWAALNGHSDVVSFLISKSADVMAENIFKKTPFDEAMARDHKECCELLVKEEVRLLGPAEEDEAGDRV